MRRTQSSRERRLRDRRHYPRAKVGGSAVIHAPRGVLRCEISNLSAHGALLRPAMAPGLDIEPDKFRIVGVPTRAGSFSFQIMFSGI